MEILVLPFVVMFLWIAFFIAVISRKATESKSKEVVNRFWFRFFFVSLGWMIFGSILFKILRINGLFPSFIESTVLAHAGGFIGFLFGAIYVLVNHESKKN